MTNLHLAHQRLYTQHIAGTPFETPVDVARHLTAVQSQDYAGARWALGLRLKGVTDAEIDQAVNSGAILRTHVMRPTWHFVLPEDIGWMLALTAPRVKAKMVFGNRASELTDAEFSKCNDTLIKALRGKHATRAEVIAALNQAGISTDGLVRFTHLMMNAELDGIICSGAWRGKQPTYALLDERAPNARMLTQDEALAELTRRYFISHGPAQIKDFVWWSGLTTSQAKSGLEMVKSQLHSEVIDGQTYWFGEAINISKTDAKELESTAYLLPNYDEYIVAYADRSAIYDGQHVDKLDSRGNVLFNNTIVINGQIVGTWKRTVKKTAVEIQLQPFAALTADQNRSVAAAAQRYGDYHALRVTVA